MKTVLRVFARDMKNITKNAMAIILAAGVLILPSLYAWVNIYANWDPYGKQSTGNMQIAVMIEDKGVEFRGISVNVGEQIRENLSGNDVIDWQFVDHDAGIEGVRSGAYYAAIEVPENFSESLTSIVTDAFEAPTLTYYANEKKNAIATKITDKVVQTVQGEVNASFIETIADLINKLSGALVTNGKAGVSSTAQDLSADIGLIKASVDGLQQTLGSFESVLTFVKDLSGAVPDSELEKLNRDLNGTIQNTQDAVRVTKAALSGLTSSVDVLLAQTSAEVASAVELLDGATHLANAAAAETNLQSASALIRNHQNRISSLLTSLEALQTALPNAAGLGNTITRLKTVQTELAQAETSLTGALNGTTPAEAAASIGTQLSGVSDSLSAIGSDYKTTVQPALTAAADSFADVLGDVSSILTAVTGSADFSKISETVGGSADTGVTILQDLSALLTRFSGRLDSLQTLVSGAGENEVVNVLYNLLVTNGSSLGAFLASPVSVDTDTVYGIANYGSAMAPFYTTLAIWVGGIVMIAIFKTDVKKKKALGGVSLDQEYFGRGLTFLVFALAQGLIICLGDLYFLKIQCNHPFLFILAGCCASLVYSFFIYSLTAAFGDIGKAIVVILLVVQLGGSGGTFPIDVTPAFFRAVNPYLPFTFVINAMRECVCETWGSDYWIDLLKLAAYIPAALVFGLLVRRLLKRPVRFFTKKIEETDMV